MAPPSDLLDVLKKLRSFFEREKSLGHSLHLRHPVYRISKATGLNIRKVYRLLADDKKDSVKQKHPKNGKQLDSFDICIIRSVIHNRYLKNETVSLDVIAKDLSDRDIPAVSKAHLKNCVQRLGFRFFKSKTGRRFAQEREDLVTKRREYLQRVQDARANGNIIVYVNDTCVNGYHCGQSEYSETVTSESSKLLTENQSTCCERCISSEKSRFIVLDAGCKEVGLIPDIGKMCMVKNEPSDYSSNHKHFFNWWEKTLLPALPAPATIVVDNAPYYSMITGYPTVATHKDDILLWLIDKGLSFTYDMKKAKLLKIVNKNIPKPIIDELAKKAGHSVLRLPPKHCELNPVELVWAEMKGHVAKNTSEFKIAEALYLEARERITPEFWGKCEDHVINKVEREILQADVKQEEENIPVVIDFDDASDSDLDDNDDRDSESTESTGEGEQVCKACMETEPRGQIPKQSDRRKAVAWIHCEGCYAWFHVVCAGVKDVNADSWFCAACSDLNLL